MDQLRAMAYLDLLNGVTQADRIANAVATASGPGSGEPPSTPTEPAVGAGDPADCPRPAPDEPLALPRPAELVIPLLTLLGLAERPGEGHGLGPLDPALCRDLAASAANSARSEWCLTITDASGFAIGHGCARLGAGDKATWKAWLAQAGTSASRLAALPSRVNLTIPAAALPSLATSALAHGGDWGLTPGGRSGPLGGGGPPEGELPPGSGSPPGADGTPPPSSANGPPRTHSPAPPADYGTWRLVLPGGRRLTIRTEPVPTNECDHRHESLAYQPGDTLRHLVQVRDGDCTFPPCSRHAREADFEHATPYHHGGRTCACNAGARSRRCHRVKQSPGWNVTQPRPGWHQWTTPSGRVYIQPPKRYPA
jgi:hypothetical protein